MRRGAVSACAALLAAVAPQQAAGAKKGVLALDAFSFDKVRDLGKNLVVKFDVEYPYGDKEDAWKRFGERCAKRRGEGGLILSEVGVQDYGDDKYNEGLRDRFGIKADSYPAVRLFKGSAAEPISFSGDFTEQALAAFVKEHVGIDFGEVPPEPEKKDDEYKYDENNNDDDGEHKYEDPPEHIQVRSEEMQFLEGVYTLVREGEEKEPAKHNSVPYWALHDLRLFANKQGTWMLSDEANQAEDKGYIYSRDEKGGRHPSAHEHWLFYDGEKQEWADCEGTNITLSGPPPPPGLLDMLPNTDTMLFILAAVLLVGGIAGFFLTGGTAEEAEAAKPDETPEVRIDGARGASVADSPGKTPQQP